MEAERTPYQETFPVGSSVRSTRSLNKGGVHAQSLVACAFVVLFRRRI